MPDIRYDQGDVGVVNESRNDIVLGQEFDIVALNIVGTAVFDLLGQPPGSSTSITGTGNTRQIIGSVAGGYRVRISDDSGALPVTHTFTVLTPLGQDFPAPNESANPDANDVDTDPLGTWVNESETNLGGSFEGWHPKMIANLLLLEAQLEALAFTRVLFVDPLTPTTLAQQSGRPDQKFATIEQAVNAASANTATALVLSPGIYAEGFTVAGKCKVDVTEKEIALYSWARWQLGTSAAKVDIDITATDVTNVVGELAAFSILAYENGTPGKGGTFSEGLVPEIFGKLNYAITGSGTLRGSFNCDFSGDDSGVAIVATAASRLGMVFNRARFSGSIAGDLIDIQDAQSTQFGGTVQIDRYRRAVVCQIDANWTVARVPVSGRVEGFIGCHWDTGITFTGPAASLVVDAYTNFFVVQNSVTLAGGATKVIIHDAGGPFLPLAGGTMTGVIVATPGITGPLTGDVNGVSLLTDGPATQFLNRTGVYSSPAGGGDFTGPAGSVLGNLVSFADTTGKLGADSGVLASDVSAHIASTANPHATDLGNIGTGTLAELNAAVTDATLIADTRTLTAGAGLTGLGDLSANSTVDVVANVDGSMVINANDLQVGVLATDAQHGVRGGGTQHAVATGSVSGFMSSTDKTAFDLGPFLPLAGGVMTGDIDMDGNDLLDVAGITTAIGDIAISSTLGEVSINAWTIPNLNVDTFSLPDTHGAVGSVLTDLLGDGVTGLELSPNNMAANTGVIIGIGITPNADPTKFDQAAGFILSWDATDPTAAPQIVTVPERLAEGIVGVVTHLSISPAGALIKSASALTNTGKRLNARLPAVTAIDGVNVSSIEEENQPAFGMAQAAIDYIQLLGNINTGNQYTAAASDLTIAKAAGSTDRPFLVGAVSSTDPNHQVNIAASPTGFVQIFRDSTAPGGFNTTFQTDVPAGFFDDGSDVLQAINANNWSIMWMDFSNNGSALTVGQVEYNTLNDARAGVFTEDPVTIPVIAATPNTRRTAILVKGNATDLSNPAQAEFVPILAATTGGGSSAVLSVNTQVGIVSLGLQEIYDVGRDIEVGALGTVALTNGTIADDLLSLTRTFPGLGSAAVVAMGPGGEVVTDIGVDISSGVGATGTLLQVNNLGSGDALDVQDGSTSVLTVTGAGRIENAPTSGQDFAVTVQGIGSIDLIAGGSGGIVLDAQGGPLSIDADTTVSIDADGAVTLASATADVTIGGDTGFALQVSGATVLAGTAAGALNLTPATGEDATITTLVLGNIVLNGVTFDSAGVLDMNAQAITNAGAVTSTGFSGPVNGVTLTAAGAATDFLNAAGAYIAPDLQNAYDSDPAILVDATGPMALSNATTADDLLSLIRTTVGLGSALVVGMGLGNEAVTDIGVDISTGTGATGDLVRINNLGSGDALDVQDGGFSVLRVTGAGAILGTPTSGQDLTATTLAAGNIVLNGVTIDSAGVLDMGANAITNIGTLSSLGNLLITPAAGQELRLSALGDITRVLGDLVVEGTTTTVDSETVLVADNHLYLNAGYTAASAETGGLVVNYLPIATTDTVNGVYVAGVPATSNPTVVTTGAATFAVGQFIQISGSVDNDGLYEVLSHAANLLTIRGVGTASAVEDFTQSQFDAGASDSAAITRITVSVVRAGTDGSWEAASGSTTGLTFADFIVTGQTAGGDLNGTYPNPSVDDGADSTAIHDNVSAEISAITEKTAPLAADLLVIESAADTNAKRRVQIGNLPIPPLIIETVTGTTYTVVAADHGKVKRFTNGSAIAITVNDGIGVVGLQTLFQQFGAGQMTFSGSADLLNPEDHTKTIGQSAQVSLTYTTTDQYFFAGQTTL